MHAELFLASTEICPQCLCFLFARLHNYTKFILKQQKQSSYLLILYTEICSVSMDMNTDMLVYALHWLDHVRDLTVLEQYDIVSCVCFWLIKHLNVNKQAFYWIVFQLIMRIKFDCRVYGSMQIEDLVMLVSFLLNDGSSYSPFEGN